MNTWKHIGYYALIILAALKAIPPEIYEAARLDNATRMKTFWKITLPMLSPQLFFLLITITTGSFKVFDSVRLMTGGGPGTSTQVISLYIYNYAFQRNNSLGIGSAAGVILMLVLILVTLFDFKGLEKRVHY
jgi:sn-glycerol 3-phosphate transport system permease protein